MSKFYCNLGHKWCRYCRNIKDVGKTQICNYNKNKITDMENCPRLLEIKTIRFSEMLQEVDFDKAFSHIIEWYPNQADCYDLYKKVYDKIQNMTPNFPKLGDTRISIDRENWEGKYYPSVHGKRNNQYYGLEFLPWKNWISMSFTEDTLKTFTPEEIIGACLYEMTYNGFDEETIENKLEELRNAIPKTEKNK